MSVARFRVTASKPQAFDGASSATVEINRARGLFAVRPYKRRARYELPLADVAEAVLWKVLKAELAERKRAKRLARRKK